MYTGVGVKNGGVLGVSIRRNRGQTAAVQMLNMNELVACTGIKSVG